MDCSLPGSSFHGDSPGKNTGVGCHFLHTQWNKSKTEKQISYINTYMWNLEKWCRWSYLQSRNRDRQIENKCMFKKGEKEVWDEFGDWDWHIYIFRMRRQSSHSIRKPLYSPRSIHATHEIQKLLCWFCYSPQGLHPLSHHLILCKGVPLVFNEGSLH